MQYVALTAMLLMVFSFNILRTELRVIVKDDSGEKRLGTEVSLFNTIDDFSNDKKSYDPIVSNKKGRAIFNNVGKGPFYLEAENEDITNSFGNQSTDTLQEGIINKIDVVITD